MHEIFSAFFASKPPSSKSIASGIVAIAEIANRKRERHFKLEWTAIEQCPLMGSLFVIRYMIRLFVIWQRLQNFRVKSISGVIDMKKWQRNEFCRIEFWSIMHQAKYNRLGHEWIVYKVNMYNHLRQNKSATEQFNCRCKSFYRAHCLLAWVEYSWVESFCISVQFCFTVPKTKIGDLLLFNNGIFWQILEKNYRWIDIRKMSFIPE